MSHAVARTACSRSSRTRGASDCRCGSCRWPMSTRCPCRLRKLSRLQRPKGSSSRCLTISRSQLSKTRMTYLSGQRPTCRIPTVFREEVKAGRYRTSVVKQIRQATASGAPGGARRLHQWRTVRRTDQERRPRPRPARMITAEPRAQESAPRRSFTAGEGGPRWRSIHGCLRPVTDSRRSLEQLGGHWNSSAVSGTARRSLDRLAIRAVPRTKGTHLARHVVRKVEISPSRRVQPQISTVRACLCAVGRRARRTFPR